MENITNWSPSQLVAFWKMEGPFAWVLFFTLLVVAVDLYWRHKMNQKKLKNPSKHQNLPAVIPYDDPIGSTCKFFYRVFFHFDMVRHPKYMLAENFKNEEETGVRCRQSIFFGSPMIVSWDPDHFRDVSQNAEDFGKVMGFSKGFDNISKRSILFVEGQEWVDQKRLIHPAFRFTQVKNQIPKFNEIARRFVDKIGAIDGPVEMLPWTSKATLDGLSMAGFGLDMGALLDQNTEAYEVYNEVVSRFQSPATMLPLYEYLPIEKNRSWKRAIKLYVKYLADLVGEKRLRLLEEQRTGEEKEGKDILDLLIAARDEDEDTGLTDDELIHNVNIFFLAGHETSSSTIAFATHMLAENPNVQQRLFEEVQSVVGDRELDNDDFTSLKYTGCFLKEVMRLYPAAVGIIRKSKKDVLLGNYQIGQGTMILLSSYTMQRHPAFWEKPDEFWPDRWMPEHSKGRHPFSYTPFSAGSRACIGKQFALIEMKILLIKLVQTFKVLKNPADSKAPFEDGMGVVLRPPVGATVILEKRK